MPDRGERRIPHRLCDSVSGVNWRPTRFDDELTLSRYSCCVCHVIPSTTVVLPCSHALCELCVTGCVVQDGGSVCPLDAQPFCEDECQKLKLPAKTKNNLKAHCWNDADGCEFVGTIETVLLHFDRECAFHALQCPRCERRILRTDIAAHYVAGCSQNASCASSAQSNRQDTPSTSCYESAILEKLSALQTQMNGLSGTSDTARLNGISRAVSAFESSCLRGMKGVESNIISTMTQQLNAVLEEVKMLVRDPLSDQLSSLQSQVNELVEQSRQHDTTSEMQEVVGLVRDTQAQLKQDRRAQSQLMARMLRDTENELKEDISFKLQEFVHALRYSAYETKEHVSKAEANLSSKLTEQHQSLQRALDSFKQNNESNERERPLATAALGKEEDIARRMKESLIPLKLEVFVDETVRTLEFLRQQIYKHRNELWVSDVTDIASYWCTTGPTASLFSTLDVTLGNASVLSADKEVFTVANIWYYRDVCTKIIFEASRVSQDFFMRMDCIKTLGKSSFSFTNVTVEAVRMHPETSLPFHRRSPWDASCWSREGTSYFTANFYIEKRKLAEGGFIEDGELTLRIAFR